MKNTHFLFFLLLSLSIISCTRNKKTETITTTINEEVKDTVKNTIAIIKLKNSTQEKINDWTAYINFQNSLQQLYTDSINKEEILAITDDLLEKQKEFSKSEFPSKLDGPRIKSRITVIQTYILELKELANVNMLSKTAVIIQKNKIIEAFNTLKKQFSEILEENQYQELLDQLKE